jgi:hypothetical protein
LGGDGHLVVVPCVGATPPAAGETVRLTGYGLISDTEPATIRRLQTGQFLVDRVDALLETSGRALAAAGSLASHRSQLLEGVRYVCQRFWSEVCWTRVSYQGTTRARRISGSDTLGPRPITRRRSG